MDINIIGNPLVSAGGGGGEYAFAPLNPPPKKKTKLFSLLRFFFLLMVSPFFYVEVICFLMETFFLCVGFVLLGHSSMSGTFVFSIWGFFFGLVSSPYKNFCGCPCAYDTFLKQYLAILASTPLPRSIPHPHPRQIRDFE